MGWYFSPQSKVALIRELTAPCETERTRTTTLAHSLCDDVLWSVSEATPKDGNPQRYIRCDLLEYRNGMWGYKPLQEAMQPYYYSCPLAYLDMAPEQSRAWRDKVRAWHAQRRAVTFITLD